MSYSYHIDAHPLRPHKAKFKQHRCDLCGRLIPKEAIYWSNADGSYREHTNCLDYEHEPVLPVGYNQKRKTK
jgi:hypothetical protein